MTATTLRDVNAQRFYEGLHVDSIARRVWGRKAEFVRSQDPNNPYDMVVRTDRFGTHVEATVLATPRPGIEEL